MIDIRSSWEVSNGFASPLGERRTKMGTSSPQRQRIRDRIARYGVTSADTVKRHADVDELAEFRELMKERGK